MSWLRRKSKECVSQVFKGRLKGIGLQSVWLVPLSAFHLIQFIAQFVSGRREGAAKAGGRRRAGRRCREALPHYSQYLARGKKWGGGEGGVQSGDIRDPRNTAFWSPLRLGWATFCPGSAPRYERDAHREVIHMG